MITSPMVLDHYTCLGNADGRPIRLSSVRALSLELVSLGADKILFPAPASKARDEIRSAIETLPKSRKKLVELVDENCRVYSEVTEYLQPLRDQATKWPEDAFIDFGRDVLYKIALGQKFKAASVDIDLVNLLEFIPIIDKTTFHGEASFRLEEFCRILTSFEANCLDRLQVIAEVMDPKTGVELTNILKSAHYASLTASMGSLGYPLHPSIILGQIHRYVSKLVGDKRFQSTIKAGAAVSGLPMSPVNLGSLGDLLRTSDRTSFSPVSIDLPMTTKFQIYRSTMAAAGNGAKPIKGSIYAIETMNSHRWLNEGEEAKITFDPDKDLKLLQQAISLARKSLRKGRYR